MKWPFQFQEPARFLSKSDLAKNLKSQLSMAPQTLAQLRAHGVGSESRLRLEFFFFTDTEEKASNLAAVLTARGYATEHGIAAADDGTFIVTGWTDRILMSEGNVTGWTESMCRTGFESDCEFDGWGTNPSQEQAP